MRISANMRYFGLIAGSFLMGLTVKTELISFIVFLIGILVFYFALSIETKPEKVKKE